MLPFISFALKRGEGMQIGSAMMINISEERRKFNFGDGVHSFMKEGGSPFLVMILLKQTMISFWPGPTFIPICNE
jgi:hypothetical protein